MRDLLRAQVGDLEGPVSLPILEIPLELVVPSGDSTKAMSIRAPRGSKVELTFPVPVRPAVSLLASAVPDLGKGSVPGGFPPVSIGPCHLAEPLDIVILPYAGVRVAVVPGHRAAAVSMALDEPALIHSFVLVGHGALAGDIALGKTAVVFELLRLEGARAIVATV